MSLLAALLLGILQGVTEFLPVSSSGHLVLAQAILRIRSEGVLMEVLLHVGTALVVLFFYRGRILDLLRPRGGQERNRYRLALVAGLVPTALVGFFLKEPIETLFERPEPAVAALALTGLLLLATRFTSERGRSIGLAVALGIGLAQAVAIAPGISRSGATISVALFLGVRRREAAEFSFLLSVPAILGAALLEAGGLAGEAAGGGFLLPAIAGTVAASLAGYVALRFLVRVVARGTFHRFGWYCLAVAAAGGGALLFLSGTFPGN